MEFSVLHCCWGLWVSHCLHGEFSLGPGVPTSSLVCVYWQLLCVLDTQHLVQQEDSEATTPVFHSLSHPQMAEQTQTSVPTNSPGCVCACACGDTNVSAPYAQTCKPMNEYWLVGMAMAAQVLKPPLPAPWGLTPHLENHRSVAIRWNLSQHHEYRQSCWLTNCCSHLIKDTYKLKTKVGSNLLPPATALIMLWKHRGQSKGSDARTLSPALGFPCCLVSPTSAPFTSQSSGSQAVIQTFLLLHISCTSSPPKHVRLLFE